MAKAGQQATRSDYQILGVRPGVTAEELHAIYKSLVKRWHPDRFADHTPAKYRAEDKLKIINAAYSRIRSDLAAFSGEQAAGSTGFADGPPSQPSAPKQPRRPAPAAAPSSGSATKPLRQAQGWFWNLRHSKLLQLLRARVGFAVLSMFLLGILALDTYRFPLRNDRPDLSPAGNQLTPPPLLPFPSETQTPTPLLPQTQLPPSSSLAVDGPTVKPAREGHRRPAGVPAENTPYFTLGSLKRKVLEVQGKPQRISGQTWVYGLSEITFKEGRVSTYNNFDSALHVKLIPSVTPPVDQRPTSFSIGADGDDVLLVQGTPTRVEPSKWYYGLSEVTFKDGRVVAYNNFFNTLKVKLKPSDSGFDRMHPKYFTIGSSQDEVLAAQGTPTSVRSNLWSYELSDVWFHEGKVRAVNDFSNLLKYRPKE